MVAAVGWVRGKCRLRAMAGDTRVADARDGRAFWERGAGRSQEHNDAMRNQGDEERERERETGARSEGE